MGRHIQQLLHQTTRVHTWVKGQACMDVKCSLDVALQRGYFIEDMLDLNTIVPVAGTLPPSWGSRGCFADLIQLGMWNINVSGPLPTEWGMPTSFKKLQFLVILNCNITG